jgi:Flp pilus assembly protein TadG
MVRLKKSTAQDGLVTVELAVLLPLLLFLTFGVIEYGWVFLKAHQITNAARHGARLAVLPDTTDADVQSAVADIMSSAGMDSSGYTLTMSPDSVFGLAQGETVTVSVSVQYDNIKLTGIPLIPVPSHLSSQTTMSKEGP